MNEVIELKNIDLKRATIYIEGDSDLVLNKMNARAIRILTNPKGSLREEPNIWEDIITAVHWDRELPKKDTRELTEEDYVWLLNNAHPCFTAFGMKKALCAAVTRNEIDKYSTKFDNAMNVVADRGLIPIEFTEASIDERLMSPKRGAPVLCRINHFSGWKAKFDISYTTNVYSLNQIVNIINLAGFGLGIGSGRTSGYGRFHVSNVV